MQISLASETIQRDHYSSLMTINRLNDGDRNFVHRFPIFLQIYLLSITFSNPVAMAAFSQFKEGKW